MFGVFCSTLGWSWSYVSGEKKCCFGYFAFVLNLSCICNSTTLHTLISLMLIRVPFEPVHSQLFVLSVHLFTPNVDPLQTNQLFQWSATFLMFSRRSSQVCHLTELLNFSSTLNQAHLLPPNNLTRTIATISWSWTRRSSSIRVSRPFPFFLGISGRDSFEGWRVVTSQK